MILKQKFNFNVSEILFVNMNSEINMKLITYSLN